MGFSRRSTNWVSISLSNTSRKILRNGNPGQRICHARGLWQGDLLSPMLFVLVMEPLNALLRRAEEPNLFTPLGVASIRSRASLYADNVVIFLRQIEQDLNINRSILRLFVAAPELHTNEAKCRFSPIRCTEDDISTMGNLFTCEIQPLSCKYLRGYHCPLVNYQN